MVTIARDPGPGHHALMAELHGVLDRAETNGIPIIEQAVLLAQLIGQKISDLDPTQYEIGAVMEALAKNMLAGNQQAGGTGPVAGHG